MLLIVCIGSIYASQDINDTDILNDYSDDDLIWDDDETDFDDDADDFEDESDDEDLIEDIEIDDSNYSYSDFDFLKYKITHYLDKYGNCSTHNWTESEEFISEYQIYITNSSNYTLNESSEGYDTYLKIYDSITSTFREYNLTENETSYLKFMIIFYLNHYGNVSANYTWNESDSFANYTPPFYSLGAIFDFVKESVSDTDFNRYIGLNNFKYLLLTNSTDVNLTSNVNSNDDVNVPAEESLWKFILMFILMLVLLIVIIF